MTRLATAMMGLFVLGPPAAADTHPGVLIRYYHTAVSPYRHLDVSSSQSEPTMLVELDTNRMTVGDRLHVTITVEHDAGTTVVWPDSFDWGSFEVLDAELIQPIHDDNRIRESVRFAVSAFEIGELEVPAFEVSLAGADGIDLGTLRSEPQSVSVVSVGLDQTGDIRAIKGPRDMPRNWLLLLPWILAMAGMVAAGYWAYRRMRARAVTQAEGTVEVRAKPPHEVAYEALTRLERAGMLERGAIKEYFIEVSDIIRRYIEGRYRVDALEMASYEVIAELERAGVTLEVRLQFERFLGDCDLVKFAKWIPEMGACREMVPRARKLVDETRPESLRTGPMEVRADGLASEDVALTATASSGGGKLGGTR